MVVLRILLPLALLALLELAKPALGVGCNTHTFTTCADGITHWYDPEDGQICDLVDCGGGRAPVKDPKPLGCAGYTGTEVETVSYLSCWPFAGEQNVPIATTTAEIEDVDQPETSISGPTAKETEGFVQGEATSETQPSSSEVPSETSSKQTSVSQVTSAAVLPSEAQSTVIRASSSAVSSGPSSAASPAAPSAASSAVTSSPTPDSTPANAPNSGQIFDTSLVLMGAIIVGAVAVLY